MMNIPRLCYTLMSVVIALSVGYLLLKGSGFFPSPAGIDVALFGVLLILLGGRRGFYLIGLPFCLLYWFYLPVGLSFGAPSYAYLASLFATDAQEAKEFLSHLELQNYLIALLVLILLLAFPYFRRKSAFLADKQALRFGLFFAILPFSQPLWVYPTTLYQASLNVWQELQQLNRFTLESEWGKSELRETPYQDYVLIIGESARRDYHQLYGYPLPTTPFLSQANALSVDGFHAAGRNTISSLRLMLTHANRQTWEPNYALNLVDLVKSAGIQTHWLSNQGLLGQYDTPISAIAKRSDMTFFTKYGESQEDSDISDFALLPAFEAQLAEPSVKKRFFVLHLYGSHPDACVRVQDYPTLFEPAKLAKKYHYLNCYISSIHKTDKLISMVYAQLSAHQRQTGRAFSIIYISDHGLSHRTKENDETIYLNNNYASRYHYDIPLVLLSSDRSSAEQQHNFKTGVNFTQGVASWIGIQNPKLDSSYSLFDGKDDADDFGVKEKIREITYPADPALDLRH